MRRLGLALIGLALAAPAPAGTNGPDRAAALDAAIAAVAAGEIAAPGAAGEIAAPGAVPAPADPAAISALVAALRQQEAALAALRGSVRAAGENERALTEAFDADRGVVQRLLATLEAMSLAADGAPAPHPGGPLAAARAERLIGWLKPALETRARGLADRVRQLEAAQAQEEADLAALTDGLARLARGRSALVAALDADRAAEQEGAMQVGLAARDAPPEFAREADNLSALAARLAALSGPAAAAPAPVPLRWPVMGTLRSEFEAKDSAGVRRPGLVVEAAPLSLVVAPADGVVRYAGPFLEYGYVVVLEPRADVLVVLAGLATLETKAGERVRAGDLLGLLGGRELDAQEYLMLAEAGNGETGAETLYIELRHGKGPVDPAPWFAGANG
ncbi:peptidoglycan DD-metalloendopeptidase family protein [Amaricoccus sp.]|uniref:murein hydrolase activator EnvC family protein n=1 Tax=Amaricoccus sp. TaxID=1872485 RepID=UPI001B4A7284|nr:peptidoglycan DD-metalloendopeptidase family protein [Amaricoccus sp.]MBP7003486.1 peptidoglycan DD-metalloendopeptidase family protein [Amaricoccus sp.]